MSREQKKIVWITALIGLSQGMNLSFGALVGAVAQAYPERSVDLVQFTVTIFNLSSVFAGLGSGWLVSRYSKKKLILAVLCIYLVSGMGPLLIGGFWTLMFFRFFSGFAVGMATPVTMALISDYFDNKGRVAVSGIQGSSIGIGALLGSLLGGILANNGYRMGFLPYLYSIIPILAVLRLLPDTAPVGGSRRDRRVPKGVLALALAMFLYAMASCAYETNISLHIGGPYAGDPTVSGIVCGVYSVLQTAMGFFMGAMYRKLGRFTLPVTGLSSALGFYILAFSPNSLPLLFLGSGLCGASYCTFISQIIAEASFRSNAANTAMSIACIEIAKSCGRLLTPLILNRITRLCFGDFTTFGALLMAAIIMTLTNGSILGLRCRTKSDEIQP